MRFWDIVMAAATAPSGGGPAPPPLDDLGQMLLDLEGAGKLVCAWYLPDADPDYYLTLNGANVEGWAAAYGSQKVNLAHETAAPQWDATLFSNKGGLTFNGTDQRLLGTGNVSNWPNSTADLYMLAAVRQDADGATSGTKVAFAYGGDAATQTRNISRAQVSSVNRARAAVNSINVTDTTNTLSGAHTIGAVFDLGGTSAVYFDGASAGTASTASGATALNRTRLGAGNASGAANFWHGAIVCAAILNSTATLTDFTDLEALMRARLS